MAKSNSVSSGCLVLIGIVGIFVLAVSTFDGSKESKQDSQNMTKSPHANDHTHQQQKSMVYLDKEELPEDDIKTLQDEVQELINKYNKIIDEKIRIKEQELMSISVIYV